MTEEGPSDGARIRQAAADWFAALDAGDASVDAFEAWRGADPRHAAAYARILAAGRTYDSVKTLVPKDPAPARSGARKVARRTLLVTGAAAAAVLGATPMLWPVFAGRARAQTSVGERRTIRIEEVVVAELNTDSHVAWRANARGCTVWLERGEVSLRVTNETPVTLVSAGSEVLLSQGRFNARRRGEALDVYVLSGSCQTLATTSADDSVVKKGQAVLVSGSSSRVRPLSEGDIRVADAWRQDELVFDGVPLGTAVAEYNRYLKRKIVIADVTLEAMTIGGRFTTHDPDDFARGLESSLGLHVTRSADGSMVVSR